MTRKNLAFLAIGTVVLAGSAVVAYIKREAIKKATDDIVDKVKNCLNKEQPAVAD